MESPYPCLTIDQLADEMNWWKGLVLELKLILNDEHTKHALQLL